MVAMVKGPDRNTADEEHLTPTAVTPHPLSLCCVPFSKSFFLFLLSLRCFKLSFRKAGIFCASVVSPVSS